MISNQRRIPGDAPYHIRILATHSQYQAIIANNDRVQILERSLRCFHFGLIGLLPGIGVPFAVLALEDWLFVFKEKAENWNPAKCYLHCGAIAAIAGLLLTMVLTVIIAIGISSD